MATHFTPALRADDTYSLPVKVDRFAQLDGRPQRTQPLMRKYEVASLLECGDVRTSHHLAPAVELFEATSSAFARGTLISTPHGDVAIEDLLPGDMIDTASNGPQQILWIGATTFLPGKTAESSTLDGLTRVMSDEPFSGRDFLTGPAARLIQRRPALDALIGCNQVLTPVRDLEDGGHVIRVTPPSPVRLFHLRLAQHTAIYAGGHLVESYHPGRNICAELGTNMRSLFLSMFPNISEISEFGSLSFPRMSLETLESLTQR